MEKKTIGSFIAVLRKARGLTQQEVADRLNVSNKAISRWERDECAPDLSLIPAIAELFDVTCDELLRGERIHDEESIIKTRDAKHDKQFKYVVNRSLISFKNMIWIAIALSVIGYILMLSITYGFYNMTVPAFGLQLLFCIASLVITVTAVNRLKGTYRDNELFDSGNASMLQKYENTLSNYSYAAVVCTVAAIALSIPLLLSPHFFVEISEIFIGIDGWVLSFGSYFAIYILPFGTMFSAAVFLLKGKYVCWICEKEPVRSQTVISKARRNMNRIQIVCIVCGALLFLVAPFFDRDPYITEAAYGILQIAGLLLCLSVPILFFVFLKKNASARKMLYIPGIRNCILSMLALRVAAFHTVTFVGNGTFVDGVEIWTREDLWSIDIILVICGAMCCFLVSTVIEKLAERRKSAK